jgi:hypothetical protein
MEVIAGFIIDEVLRDGFGVGKGILLGLFLLGRMDRMKQTV